MSYSIYNNSVFNSSITVFRNIERFNFTNRLSDEKKSELYHCLSEYILRIDPCFKFIDLLTCSPVTKGVLYEKGQINREMFTACQGQIAVSDKNKSSFGINIFDHLTIYSASPVLDLKSRFYDVYQLEGEIGKTENFAANTKLGYLSPLVKACGMGMFGEVRVFLPGLSTRDNFEELSKSYFRKGYELAKVNPVEGVVSSYFTIRTIFNYGVTEQSLIEGFEDGVRAIIDLDRDILTKKYNNQKLLMTDNIYRSYGILANARLMKFDEAVSHLDNLRTGLILGLDTGLDADQLNRITGCISQAHISDHIASSGGSENCVRADIIRAMISSF